MLRPEIRGNLCRKEDKQRGTTNAFCEYSFSFVKSFFFFFLKERDFLFLKIDLLFSKVSFDCVGIFVRTSVIFFFFKFE